MKELNEIQQFNMFNLIKYSLIICFKQVKTDNWKIELKLIKMTRNL